MKREKISRREALQRISSQSSTTEKRKYADYVINTSGPFTQTRQQAVKVYEKLRKLPDARK
jgi:dephospho-CoA kinase